MPETLWCLEDTQYKCVRMEARMGKDFFELVVVEQQRKELEKVISLNESTEKFGVRLSEQDVLMLLKGRKDSLKDQERVEFGEGILNKLVFAFCDSPYIYQDNYADTIAALQDIFYRYKNETMDELTDDELIELMKDHFDGDCQGSIDYLEETCLEGIARELRRGDFDD